jgi:hypothetical protein
MAGTILLMPTSGPNSDGNDPFQPDPEADIREPSRATGPEPTRVTDLESKNPESPEISDYLDSSNRGPIVAAWYMASVVYGIYICVEGLLPIAHNQLHIAFASMNICGLALYEVAQEGTGKERIELLIPTGLAILIFVLGGGVLDSFETYGMGVLLIATVAYGVYRWRNARLLRIGGGTPA